MQYTKIKEINEYVTESINPMKTPDEVFEMYSVPIYDIGHPEYLRGDKIGSNKMLVRKNDVLLCKINPRINRVWVVQDESEYKNIASSEWIVVRNSDYNPEFLAWYFRNPKFKKLMMSEVTGIGGSLTRAQPKAVAEYPVPVMKRQEQDKIVKVLNTIAGVIKSRQQELEKMDELIKARFVEMFGDAVDNPMGWEKRQLQGIVTDDCTISYGIVQTGDEQEEGVPVFRPIDIVNKVPKLVELKKTTEEISNKYKRTILKGRELLITVRANIADTCIVGEEFKGCNVGRGIVPIRTQEDIMVLEFLKYLLDSKHLNDDIKSKAKGITLIQLNMEDLREVELIIPPIEKQMAFVEFAKQVNKSKVAVQKALDETQLLFDSLMQKYFG